MRTLGQNLTGKPPRLSAAWLPHIILILTLLVTFLTVLFFSKLTETRRQAHLELASRQVTNRILIRMESYIALLRGGAGLFAASGEVDKSDFSVYAHYIRLEKNYPGIQGVGFSVYIAPEQKDKTREILAKYGENNIRFWPPAPEDETHAILFLEPLNERNQAALGYNMYSEPVRRQAMRTAMRTGQPAMSGKVTLVQEIFQEKQSGFLIYVPVYSGPDIPTTTEERLRRFVGFVYAPFRAEDLLQGIFGEDPNPLVDFILYDGAEMTPQNLMHSYFDAEDGETHLWSLKRNIVVAGQPWTLLFRDRPQADAEPSYFWISALTVLGILLSLVLYAILSAKVRSEHRLYHEILQANAELIRLNRIKSDFTSTVSHELRTPLAAIKESINLIRDGVEGPVTQGQHETLEIAVNNVNRLTRLIENILSFSKMESNQFEMHYKNVILNDILSEVGRLMAFVTQKKNVQLQLELPSEPVKISCDPDKLTQVVINLVDNARKFTPKDGQIVVRLVEKEDFAVIQVEDNGIGIKPEDQERIFEMYMQSSEKGNTGGAGVGLSVSKVIVEQHGGTIRVKSTPGKGSCFIVTLPLHPGEGMTKV